MEIMLVSLKIEVFKVLQYFEKPVICQYCEEKVICAIAQIVLVIVLVVSSIGNRQKLSDIK